MVKIISKIKFGDTNLKGGKAYATREIITKSIPDDITKSFIDLFNSLGKVDFMRIDGRIFNNKFYLIELTPDASIQIVLCIFLLKIMGIHLRI